MMDNIEYILDQIGCEIVYSSEIDNIVTASISDYYTMENIGNFGNFAWDIIEDETKWNKFSGYSAKYNMTANKIYIIFDGNKSHYDVRRYVLLSILPDGSFGNIYACNNIPVNYKEYEHLMVYLTPLDESYMLDNLDPNDEKYIIKLIQNGLINEYTRVTEGIKLSDTNPVLLYTITHNKHFNLLDKVLLNDNGYEKNIKRNAKDNLRRHNKNNNEYSDYTCYSYIDKPSSSRNENEKKVIDYYTDIIIPNVRHLGYYDIKYIFYRLDNDTNNSEDDDVIESMGFFIGESLIFELQLHELFYFPIDMLLSNDKNFEQFDNYLTRNIKIEQFLS